LELAGVDHRVIAQPTLEDRIICETTHGITCESQIRFEKSLDWTTDTPLIAYTGIFQEADLLRGFEQITRPNLSDVRFSLNTELVRALSSLTPQRPPRARSLRAHQPAYIGISDQDIASSIDAARAVGLANVGQALTVLFLQVAQEELTKDHVVRSGQCPTFVSTCFALAELGQKYIKYGALNIHHAINPAIMHVLISRADTKRRLLHHALHNLSWALNMPMLRLFVLFFSAPMDAEGIILRLCYALTQPQNLVRFGMRPILPQAFQTTKIEMGPLTIIILCCLAMCSYFASYDKTDRSILDRVCHTGSFVNVTAAVVSAYVTGC
jgi:hypothetical protein